LVCAAANAEDEKTKITATIDIDANVLEYKASTFSDSDIRQYSNNTAVVTYPFGNFNYKDDTSVNFSYTGDLYGATLSLNDLSESNGDGIGGIKAWIMPFGPHVKITAGTDIGAGYADSLDADPGMRVYTGVIPSEWDASKDPDNITQDQGLLLDFMFKPLTVSFAGQYHAGTVLPLEVSNSDHAKWVNVEQRQYGMGGRVGYEIGDFGKVNASYILQYSNIGANNYRLNREQEAVASVADAEVSTHMFGVYASLTPFANFGVTVGYDGVFTKYLEEFYRGTATLKTLQPEVFKSAVNLNLRYKGIPKLTLRTDHNISFWTDRDYRIFNVPGWENAGLNSDTLGASYAEVNHFLLWNGVGVVYQFTEKLRGEIYVRNLYREDMAKQTNGAEYKMTKDKFVMEPKAVFTMNSNVEMYAGITVEYTTDTASKDVNSQISTTFTTGTAAKATTDTEFVIKIPVGMTIKL
jgi:hypothetical protein